MSERVEDCSPSSDNLAVWSQLPYRSRIGMNEPDADSHVLLAACREDEVAYEASDRGGFTQALLKVLKGLADDIDTVTYQDLTMALGTITMGPIKFTKLPAVAPPTSIFLPRYLIIVTTSLSMVLVT